MRLRTALNEFKRDPSDGGAADTSTGAFSGRGDRLVHVDPRGRLRDYSYALSGLSGLDRSRFGIETADHTYWFDDLDIVRQHYYRETTLVETEYDAGRFTVHQYDITLGRAHVTHVELRGAVPPEASLIAFLTLAPEGRESRLGRLIHEDAGPEDSRVLEVFHRDEHDYVAASTGLDDVRGQVPERFYEILDDDPVEFPSESALNRYEDTHLSGDVVVTAPLEEAGRGRRTSLVTQLSDHTDVDRADALGDLANCVTEFDSARALRTVAGERTEVDVPDDVVRERTVRNDLRVLDLLESPSGARIAGPEFDPFFTNSGGYGYTWFRDDARISQLLLGSQRTLGLDVTEELVRSARFYCETQRPDGTWPHRVWAADGSLAPGWANGRVEGQADSTEYQADQTATVVRFLATLLDARGDELSREDRDRIQRTVADGVRALDDDLGAAGLPVACQNIWEDAAGQFTHTAATFLEAFAAVADAPVDEVTAGIARDGAELVAGSLHQLWLPEQCAYAVRRTDDGLDDRLDGATLALADALVVAEEVDEISLPDRLLPRVVAHTETTLSGLYRDPDDDPVAGLIRYEGDRWRTGGQHAEKVWSLTTAMGAVAAAKLGTLLEEIADGAVAFEGHLDAAAAPDGGRAEATADSSDASADAAEPTDASETTETEGATSDESTGTSTPPDRDRGPHERASADAATLFAWASDLYESIEDEGPLPTDAGYLPEQVFDDGSADSATPLGFSHGYRLQATALLSAADALPSSASETDSPPERPKWTTGEKFAVGTAADHTTETPSRVWFTATEGTLTEVRFPRVDLMNLRTLDFVVVCEDDSYTARSHVEGSAAADDTVERRVEPTADDALAFAHEIAETGDGRGHEWSLRVEYVTDPDHDALLADVTFESGDDHAYELYAVADTALTNTGTEDRGLRLGEPGSHYLVARDAEAYTGETADDVADQPVDPADRADTADERMAAGEPLLVDEDGDRYSVAATMATAGRFDWATVGRAGGALDEFFTDGVTPTTRDSITDERVVLVGRMGTGTAVRDTLALGFARQADVSASLGEAAGALADGFDAVRERYVDTWRSFLADKPLPDAVADEERLANQYRSALMTLRAVEDKTFVGASIASPSVPWGDAVTADVEKGYGYNFVWSRDLYQVFTAFELVDDLETAADQVAYVYNYQQDERGFIPQNTYLNGITRWGGEQMDNIAYPAVMAYHLHERGLTFDDVAYDYEHVRRSASYVVRNGPESGQERWEEESGYSPSTIAAEIAGLVAASELAAATGHDSDALVYRAVADSWANRVEEWTATTTGTDRHTETPYYLRVTRDGDPDAGHHRTLANGGPRLDERNVIDAGFLELARLGIRPWDDDVLETSLDVVDDEIRVDLPAGAAFYRYNGDGYGEVEQGDMGAPWSVEQPGKGRLWPILTGERAEYELRRDEPTDELVAPERALSAMAEFANSGRMIAEQVWDREVSTAYDWAYGEGTGSATPLAWSMAQYVRLAHGIDAGRPAETPAAVEERYVDRELHAPDESPALQVDTSFRGNEVVVSGKTTGAAVAVSTPADDAYVEVTDGAFEATVEIGYGENDVVVAAAADTALDEAGTTVRRFSV
ncbi:glycoside hydrolase family 15 protein [Halobaculum sp. MBLA0147]|uniref:glycoside hydrolase family 15 protein n=1 Tax=Halobaculum sp. MBLA0147 TaxID=3079934 RepID=UPI003525ACD9